MGDDAKPGSFSVFGRAASAFIVTGLSCVFSVQAAEWDSSKGVSVTLQEIYSDNPDHTSAGGGGQFFTQLRVTPNIALKGEGARASIDLTGSLAYLAGDGSTRSWNPRLSANGKAELLQDHVFIDASATIRESVIDPFGDITLDGLRDTGNTTIVYQYSFSPYFKTRVSDIGTLLARYNFTGTSHSEGGASGSTDNSFSINFDTDVGSSSSRFTWGISNDYRKSEYEGTDGRDYISTDLNLGYRFNRRWRTNASLGREWNDYPSNDSTIGGFRWTLNTTWTPNPRTSLRIGYGGRYFGSTPTLDLSYKSRRSTIRVDYSRIVTDANSELASLEVDPITGQVFPVAVLNNDVFIDERVTASYSLQGKRTNVTLSGTHSKQDYENTSQESELTRLGLNLSRSLSGRVSANAGLSWDQQDRAANDGAETWRASLGMSVKLGQRTSLNLNYTYNQRDDDQPSESYEENRASLALSFSF